MMISSEHAETPTVPGPPECMMDGHGKAGFGLCSGEKGRVAVHAGQAWISGHTCAITIQTRVDLHIADGLSESLLKPHQQQDLLHIVLCLV